MPAAAVIPAPIAYIKVVAVEKLVVELVRFNSAAGSAGVGEEGEESSALFSFFFPSPLHCGASFWGGRGEGLSRGIPSLSLRISHFEKIRVFQAGNH